MALFFVTTALSKVFSKIVTAIGVMPILDDGADGGCNMPGDAVNGAWVNVKSGVLPSGAATETTLAAVLALETVPTIPTAITASDATDISALTTKGVLVGGDGTVIVRGTGAPSVSVTITALAGQYLPIQCSRIMAASTATGLVGLS